MVMRCALYSAHRVGWMKSYDGSGVAIAFLHVPEGEWHYRVCARLTTCLLLRLAASSETCAGLQGDLRLAVLSFVACELLLLTG